MSTDKKAKSYPKALPHRSPGDVESTATEAAKPVSSGSESSETDSGNRGNYLVIGLIGFVVLAGVPAGLWWHQQRQDSKSELPGVESPSIAKESPPPKPVAGPAFTKTSKDLKPSEKAPTKPVFDPSLANKERYLEALGGLTAAHLYQSYLNIGLLADSVENEQLDRADAERTLANLLRFMTLVDTQLERVAASDLDVNDQKALANIRRQAQSLRTQAVALQVYWATGDKEQIARYHEAREEAWAGINDLLGIESADMDAVSKEQKATNP